MISSLSMLSSPGYEGSLEGESIINHVALDLTLNVSNYVCLELRPYTAEVLEPGHIWSESQK